MPATNYPNGLTAFGAVLPSSMDFPMNGKKHWWVHGNLGSDGNDGLSPDTPFQHMSRVSTFLGSGEVVHIAGNIKEQWTSPVGIFDVSVIGEGTQPRNAASHTGNNGW